MCLHLTNSINGEIYKKTQEKDLGVIMSDDLKVRKQYVEQANNSNTIWRSYMQTDVDVIEKIQRRFTRMIPDVKDLPQSD